VEATQSTYPTGQPGKDLVRVHVSGAVDLSGAEMRPIVLAADAAGPAKRVGSVLINGHVTMLRYETDACNGYKKMLKGDPTNAGCSPAHFRMAGDATLRAHGEATSTTPPSSFADGKAGWFNSSVVLSAALRALLVQQQAEHPVPWEAGDMDAPWLGNRLKLFPYITTPDLVLTVPRVWINGSEVKLTKAFNSRGFEQAKCFLGFYYDASSLPVGTHALSLYLPKLGNGSHLEGVFWRGLSDVWTSEVDAMTTPLPAGNMSRCAEAAAEAGTTGLPPPDAKNVLYLLVDDLRPELGAYNQSTHTPNVDGLAKASIVFKNAYTNVAVCSPSRVSFLSGRRPTSTHTYNFINHIRQATCKGAQSATRWAGAAANYRNVSVDANTGGPGECCSICTRESACEAWSYVGFDIAQGRRRRRLQGDRDGGDDGDDAAAGYAGGKEPDYCALYSHGYAHGGYKGQVPAPVGVVSGKSGRFLTLTTLPQHFKQSGYLTLQSGKIFHTEQGDTYGSGMPPSQDAGFSWSDGCSMAAVNEIAQMWACDTTPGTQGCPIAATMNGTVLSDRAPFCDQVIADDAVHKLRVAAANLNATGRPFFLASGFRKPHMAWRFPAPYLNFYPPAADIQIARYPTMDKSMPAIAHHYDFWDENGGSPYVAINTSLAQLDRLYYYASVSWVDSRIGLVLDELDTLGLTTKTLTVMHSDHGWALGEHGQWQKFNNWEVGVRVPLLIRAPWISATQRYTTALAELVDIFPTMADLAGIGLPKGDSLPLDGISLGAIVKSTAEVAREAALSVFPRCPRTDDDLGWITKDKDMWQNNMCEHVDRTAIPWMGYSMRTQEWRYTEWVQWDGANLAPNWNVNAGIELYDHRGENTTTPNTCFDDEKKNVATQNPDVVKSLAKQLRNLAKSHLIGGK